jgi:hypothetical protein
MPNGFGTVYDYPVWLVVVTGTNYPEAEIIVYGTQREAQKHASMIRAAADERLTQVRVERHEPCKEAPKKV